MKMKNKLFILSAIVLMGLSACNYQVNPKPTSSSSSSEETTTSEEITTSEESSSEEEESTQTFEEIKAEAEGKLATLLDKFNAGNFTVTNDDKNAINYCYLGKDKGIIVGRPINYNSKRDFGNSDVPFYGYVPSNKGILLFINKYPYSGYDYNLNDPYYYSGIVGKTDSLEAAQEAIYSAYAPYTTLDFDDFTFLSRTSLKYIFNINSNDVKKAVMSWADYDTTYSDRYMDTVVAELGLDGKSLRLSIQREGAININQTDSYISITFSKVGETTCTSLEGAVSEVGENITSGGTWYNQHLNLFAGLDKIPYIGHDYLSIRENVNHERTNFNGGSKSRFYQIVITDENDLTTDYETILTANEEWEYDSGEGRWYFVNTDDPGYHYRTTSYIKFKHVSATELGNKATYNPKGVMVIDCYMESFNNY